LKIEYKKPRKPILLYSQEELLSLFLKGQPIQYDEVKSVWIKYYSPSIINGEPHRWASDWDKNDEKNQKFIVGVFIKMTDQEIRNRVFCWLKGCIGALIFKGYLKVIPNFDFEVYPKIKI
jgi:hypothetical protein